MAGKYNQGATRITINKALLVATTSLHEVLKRRHMLFGGQRRSLAAILMGEVDKLLKADKTW